MQQTSSCILATSVCPQASDRSVAGVGGILPHLTTLIIQDLGLVPGTGAGGHTTLGWVTGVYLSTVFCGGYNPVPPDNGSSMIYAAKFIQKYLFHIYCHLILEFYWLLVMVRHF